MINWVRGVVVSRFLRKEKASGSIPDTSIFLSLTDLFLYEYNLIFFINEIKHQNQKKN